MVSNEHLTNRILWRIKYRLFATAHPQIRVLEETDSTSQDKRFFSGEIQDDYGFRKLVFNYRFEEEGSDQVWTSTTIPAYTGANL